MLAVWKCKWYMLIETASFLWFRQQDCKCAVCIGTQFSLTFLFCKSWILNAPKAVPLHATEPLEGRGSIAPTHSRPWHQMGWVVSCTPWPRISPGDGIPSTHWTGGWVGPRAGLDTEARGKILSPLPGIETRSLNSLARNQTLYWLSYPAHSECSYPIK
jgi:hypothetical protein